jgi:hypothetical protein
MKTSISITSEHTASSDPGLRGDGLAPGATPIFGAGCSSCVGSSSCAAVVLPARIAGAAEEREER